ncbi:MAG: dinitrogenase iron-molybdenum cofactor biosynthesis protein [Halothiobacillaceae bacterium]|mgnify:CR=1 FL=1|nr:dinitrogenase iron-molybdenum cofactor biosynthesis protein [Halothiobacillaceae bacterium]
MKAVPAISRELALRIGLAARVLPGVDLRSFVQALGDKLGTPLTEEGLSRVTVADLKAILQGDEVVEPDVPAAALKEAVRLLWGEGVDDEDLPRPEGPALNPGEALMVGIASNSEENLDGHFGSCLRFLVYEVTRDSVRLIAVRPTRAADGEEDRNAARAALIADCHVLYVQSIGGPAAAKVVRTGAHPVKAPEGGPARAAIARLQESMQAPPPWLARVMGVEAKSLARFAAVEEAE